MTFCGDDLRLCKDGMEKWKICLRGGKYAEIFEQIKGQMEKVSAENMRRGEEETRICAIGGCMALMGRL